MKKLILTLFSLIWLQTNSPPPQIQINPELAPFHAEYRHEIPTPNSVYNYLVKQRILHVKIVFRQILWETGHLTSRLCVEDHNLFGMSEPTGINDSTPVLKFKHYTDWKQSVVDYKNWQEYHIRKGRDLTNYYTFLEKIRYAGKDTPLYISGLKGIDINKYLNHGNK